MKFSTSFSTLLVLSPLFLSQVSALAVPEAGLMSRDVRARFGSGGKGFNQGNNGNQAQGGKGKGANGSSTSAAAAASSTAAANATAATNGTAAASSASAANATAATNGTAVDNSAASNSTSASSGGDAQSSLTLDPAVIATGFANNGQDVPAAGQVASLTSTNNFINFCATVPNLAITNGKQITAGSCNPAPMGVIPSTANMPSAKFTFPTNNQNIAANAAFTITMAIQGMETGQFVNADENYFAAPQQVNAQGQIIGHSHVVVESLSSVTQTTPTDPTKFAFFKGLNGAAVGGVLSADVTAGLPAGTYRLASINTAANHQPALVPIAQHGSLDDQVYFTVGGSGNAAGAGGSSNSTDNAAAGGAASSAASTAAVSSAAAGSAASTAAGSAASAAASSAAASSTGAAKSGASGGKKIGTPAGNDKNGKGKRRFFNREY